MIDNGHPCCRQGDGNGPNAEPAQSLACPVSPTSGTLLEAPDSFGANAKGQLKRTS